MTTQRIPLPLPIPSLRQNMPRLTRIVRDEKGLLMTLSVADTATWYDLDGGREFREGRRAECHRHGCPWEIHDADGYLVCEGDHWGGFGSSEE
jgi:hypothetical protein